MKKIFNMMMAVAIATFTFTACEDVPEPYNNPYDNKTEGNGTEVVIEPTGDGTVDNPYNVAAAQKLIQSLGADVNSDVIYVKGIISDLGAGVSTDYWNAQFNIADDAKGTNQLLVYRSNYLENKLFTSIDQIKEGDEVIVCGSVVNYKGNTPEFTTGTYIYSINGKTTEGGNDETVETVGTKDAPKTITEALAAINAMEDNAISKEFWFVKGKVVKVTTNQENFDKYGNLNYLISEDGSENNTITVYAGDGLNGDKFSGIDALKAGDEVVVYGNIQKFINKTSGAMTPEIAKGNYLVKYTAANGNGDTPNHGTGTLEKPLTPSQAYDAVAAMEADVLSDADYYVKGKICSIKYTFSEQYGTATFNISDDGNASDKEFIAYSCLYFNNQSWKEGDTQVQVGDEVIVCGKVINYMGNTPEFSSKKNYLVSLNGNTGEGSQGGEETTGSSISVVYGDLGISGLDKAITLSDGTTLTFAKEDGNNDPIYHESTQIIRMYARNSVTVNAGSKKIASVVFNYDTYKETAYKGNDEMYGQAGDNKITPTKDDKTVTFSNVNNNTLKVVNAFAEKNSGGTQFRCTGLTITYAN
ncbi:MAG: hypothetical protein K2H97_02625 [Prevotella sp.]|nr:hypothetical protein [Prevotella sp.]